MSVEIKFKVNGREVSPDELADALSQRVFEHVKQSVTKRLSGIRCPKHGAEARVDVEGSGLENLKWKVSGCCDKLREEAQRALSKD
jgi:hypothetical protein